MPHDLNDPVTTALLATEALTAAGIQHALYGGLILAAYGEPRETKDADVAVLDPGAGAARSALERIGIESRTSFEDVRFGGLSLSRIALVGGTATTGLNVLDLVRPLSVRFGRSLFGRAMTAPLRGRMVTAVSPEDFVLLKILSSRDKDLDDAASVLRRSETALDRGILEGEAASLARELPDANVRERYRDALARAASSPGG